MHFEVPKVKLHSLREFAQHYLMIVLSILTALGLEQWIESVHHRHAAEYASARIEAELGDTLRDIQKAIDVDQEHLKPLIAVDKAIIDDVRSGMSDADINKHIRQLNDQVKLGINWPAFSTEAWDVAVANQSASWIDVDRLHRYAGAYAAQRDAANWTAHNMTLALDAPRMVDLHSRIGLGKDVDPIEFLTVLQQMINTSNETVGYLEQTSLPIKAALAKQDQ